MSDTPSANTATTPASDADRLARLALNHAVEPADPYIGRLLEQHAPTQVLAAIHAGELPDLESDRDRRGRLADRCAGYRLRLEPGRAEAGLAVAQAVGARFVVPDDPGWPVRLEDLGELRPIGIWAVGLLPGSPAGIPPGAMRPPGAPTAAVTASHERPTEAVSVVGARACTGYGSHTAGVLGADLASAGIAVVSGAAFGIDAAAHRGALAVGGPTVAVLACGIDRVYPRAHELLIRAIRERGAVISELPPEAAPTRFRFLHRNRIIAALGAGTVVVEAARRSGSLVTARLAAELGRAVMAVPGPVTSAQSAGTHALIRDGATLVTEAAQVRESCAGLTASSLMDLEPRAGPDMPRERRTSRRADSTDPTDPVDPVEELVMESLPGARAPTGTDVLALARATGVAPDAVFAALGRLAAAGRAVRLGGGWVLADHS
jgi:DNA processing protein